MHELERTYSTTSTFRHINETFITQSVCEISHMNESKQSFIHRNQIQSYLQSMYF